MQKPEPPKPPENDADHARWVREDMLYKEALAKWQAENDKEKIYREGSVAHGIKGRRTA